MKYILFILLVGGIVGCGDYEREKNNSGRNVSAPLLVRYRIDTVTVNRCQYIIVDHWHSGAIIHAGNCNNHGVPTLQDVLDESNTLIPNDSGYWIEKYKGHTKIKVVWDSLTKRWEEVMIFENGEYPLNTKNK